MPSTGTVSDTKGGSLTRGSVEAVAALAVAIPTVYVFHTTIGGEFGDFLLLILLGVGVPATYRDYWPEYHRAWKGVAWILLASVVATAEFAAFYLGAIELLALTPLNAAIGAFLLTYLGNVGVIAHARRQ